MSVHSTALLEAFRGYRNARRRARYWSGNPSYSNGVTKCTRSSRLWEKYELAMCDCRVWEAEIGRITGTQPDRYDPRRTFAAKFQKLMTSNNAMRVK